jgi:DNA-binding LytR/AlgR family response regulator
LRNDKKAPPSSCQPTIECQSAEAALAVMLIGAHDIAMVFADVRLPGAMDGIDLAREVMLAGRFFL